MAEGEIPLWIKAAYTGFVALLVPMYARAYGWTNFLWFSDVALLAMVPALWLENALLSSMMALAVVLPELAWNLTCSAIPRRTSTGCSGPGRGRSTASPRRCISPARCSSSPWPSTGPPTCCSSGSLPAPSGHQLGRPASDAA